MGNALCGQLLAATVKKERSEIEARKARMITMLADGKKELANLNQEILHLLSTAEGNILDSKELIQSLQDSKATADEIQQQVTTSIETQKEIEKVRSQFVPVAELG